MSIRHLGLFLYRCGFGSRLRGNNLLRLRISLVVHDLTIRLWRSGANLPSLLRLNISRRWVRNITLWVFQRCVINVSFDTCWETISIRLFLDLCVQHRLYVVGIRENHTGEPSRRTMLLFGMFRSICSGFIWGKNLLILVNQCNLILWYIPAFIIRRNLIPNSVQTLFSGAISISCKGVNLIHICCSIFYCRCSGGSFGSRIYVVLYLFDALKLTIAGNQTFNALPSFGGFVAQLFQCI